MRAHTRGAGGALNQVHPMVFICMGLCVLIVCTCVYVCVRRFVL
jgi:hypothetical protein